MQLDTRVPPELHGLARKVFEGLDCPRSLTAWLLWKHGEWEQLATLRADPMHYRWSGEYLLAAQASDLFRKYPGLPTGIDAKAAAKQLWKDAEAQCAKTNLRLSRYLDGGFFPEEEPYTEADGRILDFVSRVRKEVVKLIGAKPPDLLSGRFGPGATVSDRASFVTVPDKLSVAPTLTPSSLFHLVPWSGTWWGAASAELGLTPEVVRGNEFFSVSKDALKERPCAKEPSLNVFYQAACGRVMRRRMRLSGIDLQNGQSRHVQAARIASVTGDEATIDLVSASDTEAKVLVELLLPPAWFSLLDDLRSHFTLFEGRWILLEKFSSMGNGFTFELETALFCAIARAVQKTPLAYGTVSVYGDDIVVPTESVEDLVAALRFFGFTPNVRKSYWTGPFRESCGGDFFLGQAVRPYLLEESPNEPQHWISLANGLSRVAAQQPDWSDLRDRLRRAWFHCLDQLPASIRACRGPQGLGDVVIHDDPARWNCRVRNSRRYFRCYRPARYRKVRWEGFAYVVQMASALYLSGSGPKSRDRNGDIIPRDGVTGYKVGWMEYN